MAIGSRTLRFLRRRPSPAPGRDRAFPPPVAIGGIGGSGTRLVAAILRQSGFSIGADLNDELDNLGFTLLFKRPAILSFDQNQFAAFVSVFVRAMRAAGPLSAADEALVAAAAADPRPLHPPDWLQERARNLIATAAGASVPAGPWGWKEPNTHVVLGRLRMCLPGLRYIHVARNGLDMAYSDNQNQLRLWGPVFPSVGGGDPTPQLSLRYWCAVHRRVLAEGEAMGPDFLFLNYDALCLRPETELDGLLGFLGVSPSASERAQIVQLIRQPRSIGRFRQFGLDAFDPDDVEYVERLGFDVRAD